MMLTFFRLILIFGFLSLLFPLTTFAHAPGLPPFLKIDGKYTTQYVISKSAITGLVLPQDSAPEGYQVNAPINFEIDTAKLPFPPDVAASTEYFWDFGDETTTAQGLKNSHTYTKIGPYISTIKARYSRDYEPKLIQSTLINVLPSKDYVLPKSMIKVNGMQIADSNNEIKRLDFNKKVVFDSSTSVAGSSPINSYDWDIGNREFVKGPVINYTFSTNLSRIFPILRVTDQNGFYSDNFVQLENTYFEGNFQPAAGKPNSGFNTSNKLPVWLLVVGALLIIGPILGKVYYKRKHNT